MDLSEMMKNVILAGIGALATTYEKAKEIVDQLVQKGELTVKQGHVVLEQFKQKQQETLKKMKSSWHSQDNEGLKKTPVVDETTESGVEE